MLLYLHTNSLDQCWVSTGDPEYEWGYSQDPWFWVASINRAQEGVIPTRRTFAHFFTRHATIRPKFAWHRQSKFSLTSDTLPSKALKSLYSKSTLETLPIQHGCNYNPQELDKICLLWFHIGWIIPSLFIFISTMFVYTFHCLLHCLGIIPVLYSNPLFWFCLSTHFLWHRYVTDSSPNSHDGYNWKFLTSMVGLL